jgi:hypothetical protein
VITIRDRSGARGASRGKGPWVTAGTGVLVTATASPACGSTSSPDNSSTTPSAADSDDGNTDGSQRLTRQAGQGAQ